MFKKIAVFLILFYRYTLSPLKVVPSCRFYPSCSEYSIQAIVKYGFFKGMFMSICRIARCHPWHPGGYDPVR